MTTRPLSVLFVANDRAILRHATRLLTVFGYRVRSVCELGQAARLLETEQPDILLLDGAANREQTLELCRQASSAECSRGIYKLLFVDDIAPAEVARCLEAGIDDILGRPLEHGELLARLRTAARVLEFERRLSNYATQDNSTLLDKPQFLAQSANQLTAARAQAQTIACLSIEIDHIDAIQAGSNRRFVATLEGQLIAILKKHSRESLVLGRLSDRRFVVLARTTGADAASLAEKIREEFAAYDRPNEMKDAFVTLSCGIADNASALLSADELVSQSESCLVVAQLSGGNYVTRHGQFADEDKKWAELAKNGALFENTLARDIMVPCTIVVGAKNPLAHAAALFEQTQLQALPVVDEEGKLAGLVTAAGTRLRLTAGDLKDEPVSSFMTSDMASFDERTSLPALIDYFTQESPLAIVIVHKGRPTGLVTPSSLATLSEQLTTATFAEGGHRSDRSGLIVSNLCGVDS